MLMYSNQRELQCIARNTKFVSMDAARLERSTTSHRGMLTKLSYDHGQDTPDEPITTGGARAGASKATINWKVEDIEAGYNLLLADLDPEGQEYKRLNDLVTTTFQRHAEISKTMVEALGAAPTTQDPAAAPARAGGDQVKLKEGLKPTVLTLDLNPREFQVWQNKFRKYYRTSQMNTADNEEQRGYFYSCISKHLQSIITRNTPTGASIFREEGQLDESC